MSVNKDEMTEREKLLEVAKVMFRLGCFAFGGPAVHIAMLEEEVISKRKWMSRDHFLDLMGATNLIPGPNSTQMTMHCGKERAGVLGLFVGGFAFIIPAVVITGFFGWLYAEYSEVPEFEPFIYGIKPAVLAIIVGAILKLGKKALKGWELGVLGALVAVGSLLGVNEIAALLGAGLVGMLYFYFKNKVQANQMNMLLPLTMVQIAENPLTSFVSSKAFWIFLKIGITLYGSGYVLFAYLDAELVTKGLLSRQQLMDAVAVGQFTPGPILSTATFVGYQLDGFSGAVLATIGLFLPSFLLVWALNPLIPKMRKSKMVGYFLDSVNVAAVAVLASVLLQMGKETLTDWRGIVIAVLSIAITFGWKKVNAMWIILGGSILGYLLTLVG